MKHHMNARQNFLLPIYMVFLFLTGCQTLVSDSKESETQELTAKERDREAELPMSLWSPARRQMNAGYFFMLAEYEALNNNQAMAEKLFEDAYNLDSNAYLGAKWIAAKAATQPDEALLQAKKMALLYPKEVEIHILYGQLLLLRGLFPDAEKSFKYAITLDPNRLESYLGLINLYRSQDDLNTAIKVSENMLKIEPSFADGWALLAKLYLMSDQKDNALAPAERAYDLQSNDPEIIHIYALALELSGHSKKAMSLYENIFRLQPTNDELIARMVNLYKQIGDLEDAIRLLKDAEEQAGEVIPGIRIQIVFIYWELQRYKEASELLDDLAKKFPNSDRILYMAGLGHEKVEQVDAALKAYEKIDEESQFFIHGVYRSINLYRNKNQGPNAEKLAKKVIASEHEKVPEFYLVLANIYGDRKDYEAAIESLEEAIDRFPDRIELLFILGVNLEKNGQRDECINTMRLVIDKDPLHAGAMNYLGYLFAEQGENLDEAQSLIERALKLKPDDGYYLDSLGWVYYQKGLYKEALEILLKANQLAPDEGVILEHIGDAYKALGETQKAFKFYEMATKAKLEERDRDRIMKKYNATKP